MDFIKNVGLILLLLALLGTAQAESWEDYVIWNENGYYEDVDYSKFFLAQRMSIQPNEWNKIIADGSEYLALSSVLMKVESINAHPSIETNLTLNCFNETNITNIALTLTNIPTWNTEKYVMFSLPIAYNLSKTNPPFKRDAKWLMNCELYITTINASVELYLPIRTTWFSEVGTYPSDSLASLVGEKNITGTRGILNTGFDLFGIMILISVMIMFFFIVIIIYKVFRYLVNELNNKWIKE